MLDVTSVGSDLTPAQLEETLSDLAFFLDTFGSTRAVRAKLQEHESDIKRLEEQVQVLVAVGHGQGEKPQDFEKDAKDGKLVVEEHEMETEGEEDVDGTMVDLDFFLKTYKSTRAVREKLESQRQKIEILHRAIQDLEKQPETQGDGDDSSDVEYLGTIAAAEYETVEGEKSMETRQEEANGGVCGDVDNGVGDATEEKAVVVLPEHNNQDSVGGRECAASDDDFQVKKAAIPAMEAQNGIEKLPCLGEERQGNECACQGGPGAVKSFMELETASKACESKRDPMDSFRADTDLPENAEVKQNPTQGSSVTTYRLDAEANALDRETLLTRRFKRALCRYPNCVKYPQVHGLCSAHGGYHECRIDGCNRKATTRRLCRQHGGGTKCASNGCGKFAASGGHGYCRRHARAHGLEVKAGNQCSIEGCGTFAVYKGQGYCRRHAREHGIVMNGKKCGIKDCERFIVYRGFCLKHAGEEGNVVRDKCKFEGCHKSCKGNNFCEDHKTSIAGDQEIQLDGCAPLPLSSEQGSVLSSRSDSTTKTIKRRGPHVTCKAYGCLRWVKRDGDPSEYCVAHRGAATTSESIPTSGSAASGSYNLVKPKDHTCKETGCSNIGIGAGSKKGFCFRHGGGYRCVHPGCTKARQRNKLCSSHGGKYNCRVEGCEKRVSLGGCCRRHFAELNVSKLKTVKTATSTLILPVAYQKKETASE